MEVAGWRLVVNKHDLKVTGTRLIVNKCALEVSGQRPVVTEALLVTTELLPAAIVSLKLCFCMCLIRKIWHGLCISECRYL